MLEDNTDQISAYARDKRDTGDLPIDARREGLLREHRLKEGTWGRLRVLSGKIRFVWDDDEADHGPIVGDRETVIIPPTVPHHIERLATDFVLEIDFLEQGHPLPAPEDDRNGVASEWRLGDNEPAKAVIRSPYRAPSAPDETPPLIKTACNGLLRHKLPFGYTIGQRPRAGWGKPGYLSNRH